MFEKITIELNEADLTALIKERVRAEYDQDCNVEFNVSQQSVGFGLGASVQPVFRGAKVFLISNKAK